MISIYATRSGTTDWVLVRSFSIPLPPAEAALVDLVGVKWSPCGRFIAAWTSVTDVSSARRLLYSKHRQKDSAHVLLLTDACQRETVPRLDPFATRSPPRQLCPVRLTHSKSRRTLQHQNRHSSCSPHQSRPGPFRLRKTTTTAARKRIDLEGERVGPRSREVGALDGFLCRTWDPDCGMASEWGVPRDRWVGRQGQSRFLRFIGTFVSASSKRAGTCGPSTAGLAIHY